MSESPLISFVIPVYDRPQEIDELLRSFSAFNEDLSYEILIVEDGSKNPSDKQVQKYKEKLPVKYFTKKNSGPGETRNFGASHAKGKWLIFLDSDVLLPSEYLRIVQSKIDDWKESVDLFGGPDKAHSSFTDLQKSINYAMTSFFTTGGIRGSQKSLEKFKPRSFNLGVRKSAFDKLNGFANLRFGEDIDFSLRAEENNFKAELIEEAFVYHKRRSNFRQFFKQVYNSGIARIVLQKLHPGTLKIVHLLPSIFVLANIFLLMLGIALGNYLFVMALLVFPIVIFLDSFFSNRSLPVAALSIIASYTQLFGYGIGLLTAFSKSYILGRDIKYAFRDNFYD